MKEKPLQISQAAKLRRNRSSDIVGGKVDVDQILGSKPLVWDGAREEIALELNVGQMLHLSQFLRQSPLEAIMCQRNVTQIIQFGQL